MRANASDERINGFPFVLIGGAKAEASVNLVHTRREVCRQSFFETTIMILMPRYSRVGGWICANESILVVLQLSLKLAEFVTAVES